MPQGYNDPNDTVNRLRGVPGRSWQSFKAMGGPSAGRNAPTASPAPKRSVDGPIFPKAAYDINPRTVHPSGESAFRHPRPDLESDPMLL